jgi:hypothetical protein
VELILTVLRITAPVFLLGAVGAVWVRLLRWEYPLQFVTRLAMTVAVPCLIFTALMQAEIAPRALADLSLAALAAYLVAIVLFWAITTAFGLDRRTYLAPLIFGNTGNIGLPLALFAFGEVGLSYAVVVFAVMALLTFTFGIWLVAGSTRVTALARDPVVVGTVAGALFLWQGWQTPGWLTDALRLAGQMAIPLMLVTLGVAVARLQPGRLGAAIWLSALKAGLSAAIALAAAAWFGLEPVARAVLVVQFITPVAVTSYLLAERYRADAQAVAGLVVISTLMSLAVLPIALGLLLPGLPHP